MKSIPDKAEVALEYPDKFYVGTFEHASRFEAHLDPTGFALTLERPGSEDVRKSIHMHINFGLFAGILRELASTVGSIPKDDLLHRNELAQAAAELQSALKIVKQMPFPVNLWAPQNHVYSIQAGLYARTKRRAQRGDPKAQEWVDAYLNLSELLMIRVP